MKFGDYQTRKYILFFLRRKFIPSLYTEIDLIWGIKEIPSYKCKSFRIEEKLT